MGLDPASTGTGKAARVEPHRGHHRPAAALTQPCCTYPLTSRNRGTCGLSLRPRGWLVAAFCGLAAPTPGQGCQGGCLCARKRGRTGGFRAGCSSDTLSNLCNIFGTPGASKRPPVGHPIGPSWRPWPPHACLALVGCGGLDECPGTVHRPVQVDGELTRQGHRQ